MSTAALPTLGRAGSPWLLSKHSVSYCTWEGSLTPLQGQPLLASPLAPGEQPGALTVVERPLATPQLLQLSVKGCSSPSSPQPSGYCCVAGLAKHETKARLGNSQREQSTPAQC